MIVSSSFFSTFYQENTNFFFLFSRCPQTFFFTLHSKCPVFKYGHLNFFKHIPSNNNILFFSQASIFEYFYIFYSPSSREAITVCSLVKKFLNFNCPTSREDYFIPVTSLIEGLSLCSQSKMAIYISLHR